ncbi:membrane protein (plasmid) [Vibrio sp. qd031]|uniref:YeeE/YedE family protein n=1 Tax=Vibrio sp. qd031 TaxID=1603038 RepID=UPI000A1130FE|nr:YeeE/YedE family protein [Vibrio sp. qd031]ORT52549.1 membrane protein [Vibrio sp. qd031]
MSFTIPWESLFGGMLLGVSATILLLINGKIAGISGILAGLLAKKPNDFSWRLIFVAGLIGGGALASIFFGADIPMSYSTSTPLLIIAGLLVGVGTKLGNGCTSGHGICGMGRFSKRSIVATMVFMLAAAMTVFFRLHLI